MIKIIVKEYMKQYWRKKMQNDKVSIIVPIFNAEDTITRCLNSILTQTYQNLEIILINDGSKDNSLDIIVKYAKNDKRIKIINKENSGVSDTRNIGIKESTGKYLLFIDADDYIDTKAINCLVRMINKYNVDIIRYNGYIENKKGKMTRIEFPIFNEKVLSSKDNKKEIIELINHPSKSIRCYSPLLFLKNYEIISFNKKLSYLEDKVFYLENLLNNKTILFWNEPLYYYTYNNNSVTKNLDKYIDNIERIFETKSYIKEILTKNFYKNEDLLDTSYATLILYRLEYLVDNTNYKKFKKVISKIKNKIYIKKENLIYLNKIKKIQYKLLNTNHYLL